MYTYMMHLHTTYTQKAASVKTSGRISLTRTGGTAAFCIANLAARIQSFAATQRARLASQSFAACEETALKSITH